MMDILFMHVISFLINVLLFLRKLEKFETNCPNVNFLTDDNFQICDSFPFLNNYVIISTKTSKNSRQFVKMCIYPVADTFKMQDFILHKYAIISPKTGETRD